MVLIEMWKRAQSPLTCRKNSAWDRRKPHRNCTARKLSYRAVTPALDLRLKNPTTPPETVRIQ